MYIREFCVSLIVAKASLRLAVQCIAVCIYVMVTAVIGSITIGLRTCGVCVVMIMCVRAKLTSDPVTVYIHVGDLPKC